MSGRNRLIDVLAGQEPDPQNTADAPNLRNKLLDVLQAGYRGANAAAGTADYYTGGLLSSLAGLNPFVGMDNAKAASASAQQDAAQMFGRDALAGAELPMLGIFAGPMARTANRVALKRAEELAAAGAPREQIWKDTGWFKGVDGKWRWEIDDTGSASRRRDLVAERESAISRFDRAETQGNATTDLEAIRNNLNEMISARRDLGDIEAVISTGNVNPRTGPKISHELAHNELYAAYPSLGDIRAKKIPDHPALVDINAAYHPGRQTWPFRLMSPETVYLSDRAGRSSILHELQHAIQSREQFAQGGGGAGPYRTLAGEVEARAVQARANLTPKQRRARAPWLDYDVPEDQQINRRSR